MGILSLICMVLLIDRAAAVTQLTSQQDYTPAGDGRRYSTHNLDCREGRPLLLDVRVHFDYTPCCSDSVCSNSPSAADFQRYLAACENTSRCSLSVQDMQRQCEGQSTSPPFAKVFYACSSASAVLAMDRPGSTSGRTVAARFSSPDLQSSNSSWQCRVEASDCSTLNSTVELFIKNTEQQTSSFSTENVERLGRRGLQNKETTSVTPFSVTLHLVAGSRVHPAYVLVTVADINITMTCGLRNETPPTTFCNMPIDSPPVRKFGQALTAVHSSPRLETENSTWTCVVEAADCSTTTPVNVSVYIRNRPGLPASYFSSGNRTLNNNASELVNTPYATSLVLLERSDVEIAYVHVLAARNVAMTCRPRNVILLEPFCNQCESSPCQEGFECVNLPGSFQCRCPDNHTCVDIDECSNDTSLCDATQLCNNTVGSFHCYCRDGYRLDEVQKKCLVINKSTEVPSRCIDTALCNNRSGNFRVTTESDGSHDAFPTKRKPQARMSVVGPAVGGAVAALVVIAVVVVIIVFVCRKRNGQLQTKSVTSSMATLA